MPIVSMSREVARKKARVNRRKLAATSDGDIARQIIERIPKQVERAERHGRGLTMRAILMICMAVLATPAAAGERQALSVNGMAVTTPQPGASMQRFGSGALIGRPGQLVQTVAPFGSGVIVSEPGRPSVVCSPFGRGTVCR